MCEVIFRDKTVLTLFDVSRQIATAFKTDCTRHEFLCVSQDKQRVYFLGSMHIRPKEVLQMEVQEDFQRTTEDNLANYPRKRFEISPVLTTVVSRADLRLNVTYFSFAESIKF